MTQGEVLDFLRDALFTGIKISIPILLVSILVGLVISIFQAATQVNEQTLTFVPKLIAVSLVLIALGPWMLNTLADFMQRLLSEMLNYI